MELLACMDRLESYLDLEATSSLPCFSPQAFALTMAQAQHANATGELAACVQEQLAVGKQGLTNVVGLLMQFEVSTRSCPSMLVNASDVVVMTAGV